MDDAALYDLLVVAEEHAADLIPLQLLHHALYPGGELEDLPVGGVFQAGDRGDLVAHGHHLAHLFRGGLGHPVFHRLLHQGDDGVPAGVQLVQLALELAQPAL